MNDPVDWRPHARRLADELTQAGKLTAPEWRAALCAVPRHHFVPVHHRRDEGAWRAVETTSEQELSTVYADTVLLTALSSTERGATLRSSARPSPA